MDGQESRETQDRSLPVEQEVSITVEQRGSITKNGLKMPNCLTSHAIWKTEFDVLFVCVCVCVCMFVFVSSLCVRVCVCVCVCLFVNVATQIYAHKTYGILFCAQVHKIEKEV